MNEPFCGSSDEQAVRSALAEAVDGLATDQPRVADWAGPVRRRLAARRQGRRAAAATGMAALVGVAAGVVWALPGDGRDRLVADTPTSQEDPSTAPSADPAPTASPTASASASDQPAAPQSSDEPASTPSSAQAPSPRATVQPSAAPSVPPPPPQQSSPSAASPTATEPEPTYPPSGEQDIQITAQVSNERPQVGEEIVVEVEATGRAEYPPSLQGPQVDDEPYPWVVTSCAAHDQRESPPPATPQSTRMTVTHTFDTPGRHTLTFRASSQCAYYQGSDELVVVVEVQPAS